MTLRFLLVIQFLLISSPFLLAQSIGPSELMVNYLRDPSDALITDSTPLFCWVPGSDQSAYQIKVFYDSPSANGESQVVWETQKVKENESCNISYNGKSLTTYSNYWWSVRTWDINDQASEWSLPQRFITGNLSKDGYSSQWQNKPDGNWRLEDRQRAHYVERAPIDFWESKPGHFVADFGKSAFGTLKFSCFSEREGDTIHIKMGEKRNEAGMVDQDIRMTNIGYKETFVISKKGVHEYVVKLPRHISHYPNSQVLAQHMPEVMPFRLAEVIGVDNLKQDDIKHLSLYYYFDDAASHFFSNNENLNQVWDLCKYTLKATPFLSLYMDGNRERMPYEADSYIQQLGHYSVDRDYAIARYTWQFLLYNASWPTEWQTHVLMMAWEDYMYTGDKEPLVAYYNDLRKKTLIDLEDSKGLISTLTGKVTEEFKSSIHYSGDEFKDIVDWPPGRPKDFQNRSDWMVYLDDKGERDNYEFRDYNTVVNAFYYHGLTIMGKIAKVVGNSADETFFHEKKVKTKESINRYLFDKTKGYYVDGLGSEHSSLHANMIPLAFGLVDHKSKESVLDFIKSREMACSVYGAQYLLEGLIKAGEGEFAISLMTSDDKRSWMNMMKVGATMTTEAWDEEFKPNLTWNHAWGSAPANILVRHIVGVQPLEPGFGKILIAPKLKLLDAVRSKVPTLRGDVFVNWEKKEEVYDLTIYIPENSKALLVLPNQKNLELGSGRHQFHIP
jgi:hypothetical protein